MTDQRDRKLAEILVKHSTKVKPGDWVHIEIDQAALPLGREVLIAVLQAGGNPTYSMNAGVLRQAFLAHASQEQIAHPEPLRLHLIQRVDVAIFLDADLNTRELSGIDPAILQARRTANREWVETYLSRTASKDLRWVITQYPTAGYAQDAGMGMADYEDFVYRSVFSDRQDYLDAWRKMNAEQEKYVTWLKGRKQVEIRGPHAELTLSIEGRDFVNESGEENMPGGEIFTSPIENSANGWVRFSYPAIYMGQEVEGVYLEFVDGQVVKASAERNEALLTRMLELDEGARILGELGIGTNYGIDRFTKSILYDEKIGGTFHLAVGSGFEEIGGTNKSLLHWDMICDARQDTTIHVDGDLFYQDGKFTI